MRQLHAAASVPLSFTDQRGFTALHHAAAAGHLSVASLLLSAPDGPRLAATSTNEAGASASWRPAELAPPGLLHEMLRDVAAGGVAAEHALGLASQQLNH